MNDVTDVVRIDAGYERGYQYHAEIELGTALDHSQILRQQIPTAQLLMNFIARAIELQKHGG